MGAWVHGANLQDDRRWHVLIYLPVQDVLNVIFHLIPLCDPFWQRPFAPWMHGMMHDPVFLDPAVDFWDL